MSEIVFTENAKMQFALLDKIYNWFHQKTRQRIQLPQLKTAFMTTVRQEFYNSGQKKTEFPKASKTLSFFNKQTMQANLPSPKTANPQTPLDRVQQKFSQIKKQETIDLKMVEYRNRVVSEKSKLRDPSRTGREKKEVSFKRSDSPQLVKSDTHNFTVSSRSPTRVFDFRTDELRSSSLKPQPSQPITIQQLKRIHRALTTQNNSKITPFRQIDSAYNSLDVKTQFGRPILNKKKLLPLSPERQKQFIEVLEAKMKLAEKRIPCSLRDLENGIMVPDIPIPDILTPAILPRGGEKLFGLPKKPASKKKKKRKATKKAKKKGKKKGK